MNRRRWYACVTILSGIILSVNTKIWIYFSSAERNNPRLHTRDEANLRLAGLLKELARDLADSQRSLVSSAGHYFKLGRHVEKVNEMLKLLNETSFETKAKVLSTADSDTQRQDQEVCPEEFKGKKLNYGWPFFRKGFGRVDCKNFVPIEKLVTILISMPQELAKPAQTYFEAMKGVEQYYPEIRVILATEKPLNESVRVSISKLKISFEHEVIGDAGQAALWRRLVDRVKTRYVLIAPDITHFDEDINLERLVRVLSYEAQVAIVGGSHRNLRGEWENGCQQVLFRNYTATYMGGYYRSFNECIVCDFIAGPIMAKTETLTKLGFDNNLKYGAFHDLFWRLKNQRDRRIAASCPDVMFNIMQRNASDSEYVTFANKHQIHRIVESNGRVRWYGCRRGLPYTSAALCQREKGLGLSPADMENLADGIKFFMRLCEEAGAFCEMQDGTVMGALKFNGVLPWDIDADIAFLSANFSAIEKLKGEIEKAGFALSVGYGPKVKDGRVEGGYFALRAADWNIELWGLATFDSHLAVARGRRPTKVLFAGQWVNHPHNPGLYARNHYGAGTYRHQEHWRRHRMSTSWHFYNPGKFLDCPQPGHSGCLNQYPADGNMQFRRYCP